MQAFKQGETLTAERLNELVQGLEAVEVPAALAPARKAARATYAPANYNTAELVERGWPDEVEMTDYTGLVSAVDFARNITSSVIRKGEIMLPLAQTVWKHDPDAGSTPGLVYAVEFDAVEAPVIKQGGIVIPYADTDGCEGVATAGVLRDVRIDPEAVDPSIESGVLILPATGGTVELADSPSGVVGIVSRVEHVDAATGWRVRNGVIQVPLAHADDCLGQVGVISGIERSTGANPMICNGVISLPFAPAGLVDDCGGLVTWADLRAANGPVLISSGEATHHSYSVQMMSNGGLRFYINRD